MSMHQHTHVKRKIPLNKVHRACTHTYTSILHRKPQWLGHGKADVLMVSTNGTRWGGDEPQRPKSVNLPTHDPLQLTPMVSLEVFREERSCRFCSALMNDKLKVRRGGSRATVMLNQDALWSVNCWNGPLSELCWCSHKRHFFHHHGDRAVRSWQIPQALGWCGCSDCVCMAWWWLLLLSLDYRFHCCCRYWKTVNTE